MDGLILRLLTFNPAGLVALVGLSLFTIPSTGPLSYIDALLALRIYNQQELNSDAFPMAGAMRTGSTCRIGNSATVSYLQTIGRSGHLVTARVFPTPAHNPSLSPLNRHLQSLFVADVPATLLYLLAPALTVATAVLLGYSQDWWGLGVLVTLVLSRLINVVVARRIWRSNQRSSLGKKPGVDGALFILCSQDRWILLRGAEDDLQTLIAGQGSRDKSVMERFAVSFAVLSVYVAVALSFLASTMGSMAIACLLLCSSAILGLCNTLTPCLRLPDCSVCVQGLPKKYNQRLEMVKELIEASGRDDWAIGLGLITPENPTVEKEGTN
ncbi:hypothetical protein ARMSODRAFT_124752 [Armillaria solidipes]|uniref:Uncharacterized protein n=1 Tax=Armillaria solidipes TaxID=1076256 RepID=A0A2H3BSZ7_9AGAR|nr:hypothetical protein ARMSODRAFT_124752 [Armillaria solidipes]